MKTEKQEFISQNSEFRQYSVYAYFFLLKSMFYDNFTQKSKLQVYFQKTLGPKSCKTAAFW